MYEGIRLLPDVEKRDYWRYTFAGMAMQGLATTDLSFGIVDKPHNPWLWAAQEATKAADALLLELEKPRGRGC
jgi:hypothetical protein